MKKLSSSLQSLFFLLAMIFAAGVSKSEAARFGHRSGDDLKLISSLELNAQEQASLKSALSTYGPAVKTAWQNLRAKKKQLDTDLEATTPDGSQLAADAAAVANAKAQLKSCTYLSLTVRFPQRSHRRICSSSKRSSQRSFRAG